MLEVYTAKDYLPQINPHVKFGNNSDVELIQSIVEEHSRGVIIVSGGLKPGSFVDYRHQQYGRAALLLYMFANLVKYPIIADSTSFVRYGLSTEKFRCCRGIRLL